MSVRWLGRAADELRLWVHASLKAELAFAAVGYSVVARQLVQIGDRYFERVLMEMPLSLET